MTHDTNQEQMNATHSLPTHYVIGAIDDMQEAEKVVQALRDAGYAAQDILLIPGQSFIEAIQEWKQESSSFKKAIYVFFTSTDEGFPGDVYFQLARQGANVLAVYASTMEEAQQVAQILNNYSVRFVKYFGSWSTTNFPS
jgi:hypothetical protein